MAPSLIGTLGGGRASKKSPRFLAGGGQKSPRFHG